MTLFLQFLWHHLRMGLVLLILIPFWKFKIPEKKYLPSLISFSISMGVMVYVFMTLALYSSIISPVIVGSQLAIPFGILASAFILNENISPKKWIFIFSAFIGVLIIFFDPKLVDNFLGLFFASLMALSFAFAQVFSRQLRNLDISLTMLLQVYLVLILMIFHILLKGNYLNY